MPRNGQVDIMTFGIFLFAFAICTFLAIVVFTYFNEAMQANDSIAQVSKDMLDNQTLTWTTLDYSYLFLTIGLMIALFISGYFIDTHPIFMVISIIMSLIDVTIAGILTNSFELIIAEFPAAANTIPITVQVARNWPLVLLLGAVMLGIGLYSKGGTIRGNTIY